MLETNVADANCPQASRLGASGSEKHPKVSVLYWPQMDEAMAEISARNRRFQEMESRAKERDRERERIDGDGRQRMDGEAQAQQANWWRESLAASMRSIFC